MIVNQSIISPVQTSGISASGQFGVKAENLSWLFKILRNNLYSDKPLAVLREYSANALDAHVAANTPNRPFSVTLPTSLYPALIIRDYGTGLDESGIFNVFASYGESTKRTSNDSIGGFGIGSKSAFCYVNSFTITSYFNGTKTMYEAYIDETEIGKVDKIHSEPTDEENGIEISITIKPQDIPVFVSTAKTLYQHFDVKPIIRNNPEVSRHLDEYKGLQTLLESETWSISKTGYHGAGQYCVMGGLRYPIQINKLSVEAWNWLSSLHSKEFVLRCPIGSVKMSASREALEYDEKTIRYISHAVLKARSEASRLMSEMLRNCKTLWEARIVASELRGTYGNISVKMEWRGQEVGTNSMPESCYSSAYMARQRNLNRNGKESWSKAHGIGVTRNTVIYVDSGEVKRNTVFGRVRQSVSENGYSGDHIYFLNFLSASQMQAFMKNPEFVGANIIDISTIDYVAPKRANNRVKTPKGIKQKVDVFVYNGKTYAYPKSDAWNAEAVDLEDGEGVYTIIKSFIPVSGMCCDLNGLYEMQHMIGHLDGADCKVYGFREKTTGIGASWQTLDQKALSVVNKVLANKEFRKVIVQSYLARVINGMYIDMASEGFQVDSKNSLGTLLQAIKALPQFSTADSNSLKVLEKLARKVDVDIVKECQSEFDAFLNMGKQVEQDYPMLTVFNTSIGWRGHPEKVSDYIALMDKQ